MNTNVIATKINEIAKSFNIIIKAMNIELLPSFSYGEDSTNDTYAVDIAIEDPENKKEEDVMNFMVEAMNECSVDEKYDTFIEFTNYGLSDEY